jgi:hypothetical protein
VGGRLPLDDAAACMLAQLLTKHGLPARTANHDAVTRPALATLETQGVALIAVSYMEATGSPAHLRTLLRRLRQKIPGAPIVLGLWESDTPPEPGQELTPIEGADATAHTLRDAVAACVEAAHAAAARAGDVTYAA